MWITVLSQLSASRTLEGVMLGGPSTWPAGGCALALAPSGLSAPAATWPRPVLLLYRQEALLNGLGYWRLAALGRSLAGATVGGRESLQVKHATAGQTSGHSSLLRNIFPFIS